MQNLKSKYEQKEMKVSDGLWDRLEEKLDQVSTKEEKPKIVWWRYVAVVLLMIGLGGSFLMINHKFDINKNREFANQGESQNSTPIEPTKNSEVEKLIPVNNDSETDNQKLAVENVYVCNAFWLYRFGSGLDGNRSRSATLDYLRNHANC